MSKVLRVHTRFVPKSSYTSTHVVLTPGDYALEEVQPSDSNGIRLIAQNRLLSVYVTNVEVAEYGDIVDSAFQPIASQLHTLEEVVQLVEQSAGGVSFSGASAQKLAEWLKELSRSRQAIRAAREGLAKAPVW